MIKNSYLLLFLSVLISGCILTRPITRVSPNPDASAMDAGSREVQAEFVGAEASTGQQAAITDILIRANRERLKASRPPLIASAQLLQAAETRAQDMAELDYFDHVHPLRGTAEIERLLRDRYPTGRITELLYFGNCTLEELPGFAIRAWLDDPANHRELVDPDYQLAGAGVQQGADGWYAVFVMIDE